MEVRIKMHKVNILGKSVPTLLVALMLVGAGTAAVTTVFSNTVTGSGNVDTGLVYHDLQTSGSATVDSNGGSSTSYTLDASQGGTFNVTANLTNNANDKSEPFAEVFVLDANADLSERDLETVRFTAYTTSESDTQHVDKSNQLNYYVERHPDGSEADANRGPYLKVTSADLPGYQNDGGDNEILVCVVDNNADTDLQGSDDFEGSTGLQFDAGEEWEKTFHIDTQSGFPDESIDADLEAQGIWNTDGTVNPIVDQCPNMG